MEDFLGNGFVLVLPGFCLSSLAIWLFFSFELWLNYIFSHIKGPARLQTLILAAGVQTQVWEKKHSILVYEHIHEAWPGLVSAPPYWNTPHRLIVFYI